LIFIHIKDFDILKLYLVAVFDLILQTETFIFKFFKQTCQESLEVPPSYDNGR